MKLTLDVDALTFGDMEDFEQATGSELMATIGLMDDKGDMSKIKAKDMTALIWICGRADNPDFTLDEARRVKLSEIEFEDAAADPTSGDGSPS